MRKLTSFAFAVLAIFALVGTAHAQEYAPLIQKDVVSVVRINLDKVDPTQLGAQVQKLGGAAIDYFVPDLENADEIKQAFPIANLFISQYHTEFVKPLQQAGVTNVYLVTSAQTGDETIYPFVAIPIKDLSKDQVDKVRAHMKKINLKVNSLIKYRFDRNGFFFMPIIPGDVADADAKEYIQTHFKSMKAVDSDVFKSGFEAVDADDAIISAVSIMKTDPQTIESTKAQLLSMIDGFDDDVVDDADDADDANDADDNNDNDVDADEEEIKAAAKDLVEYAAEFTEEVSGLVKYNAWSVNVSDLNVVSVVEANSEDDAKKYVSLIEGDLTGKLNNFFDVLEKKAVAEIDADDSNDPDDLSKDDIQGLFASLREIVPILMKFEVNGSTLTWKLDEKFFKDNEGALKGFAKKIQNVVKITTSVDDSDADDVDDNDDNE